MFHGSEPSTIKRLEEALEHAHTVALAAATALAQSFGATDISTNLEETREHVDHDIDGYLFLSASVTAIAAN